MVSKIKDKKLRVSFCPACKSFNVKYIHTFGNLLGIIPRMRCMDCGAEASSFPVLEVTQKELDEKLEKMKIKNKNKKSGEKK